jgi:hypothetical protein
MGKARTKECEGYKKEQGVVGGGERKECGRVGKRDLI